MRPFGTREQLARRRRQTLQLLEAGHGPAATARQLETTPQTVCRWRRDARRVARPVSLGRPAQLSGTQQRRLVAALEKGARHYGYFEAYWTLDRIARLIWDLFNVRYRTSSVWYLMQRIHWSSQKPQRRSLARDDQAIAHWKRYVWPHIKKSG